jgi:heme exporter protein C
MVNLHALANPGRFMRLSGAFLPWLAAITAALLAWGLYNGLLVAPADYQQGDTVRIMYVHVPSAYLSMMIFGSMAFASAIALIWRHPVADIAAKASAPIGAGMTAAALATGMLWGQPMWGTFWGWDARLTSMLLLFFIYLGYMALWAAIDDPERAGKAAAILALVGSVNLPIIHFSVEWWNTLHQGPSVLVSGGSTIEGPFLRPMFIMLGAYTVFYFTVLIWRMHQEIIARRIRSLRLLQAQG